MILGELFDKPSSDIMPGRLIVPAWVSQADYQLDGILQN
jgi:hypothetical protein